MKNSIKNKLINALKSEELQLIIKSEDFYFQKAQNALDSFLDLNVSGEVEQFLLDNRQEYEQLKDLFENNDKYKEFGRKIFTLIAHCDSRAYNKNYYNQYDDDRVIAFAFVRMGNWVENLIKYKFGQILDHGSIKNAIDYLENPKDHFTMLSENHREQLVQNLLNKNYKISSFKEDVLRYFQQLPIHVVQDYNYTHVITRLMYNIESDWKDCIIGLMSSDTSDWLKHAINSTLAGNPIVFWNNKKPNGTTTTLKLLRQRIEEDGYFRIFYAQKSKVYYVAEIIDFVTNQDELDKASWRVSYTDIYGYQENFSDYTSDNKKASWVYLVRKVYEVNTDEYLEFKYYKSQYPTRGAQAPVLSYKSLEQITMEKELNKIIDIIKYKKQLILQGPPGTGKTRLAKMLGDELISNNQKNKSTVTIKRLTAEFLKNHLNPGDKVKSKSGIEYTILEVLDRKVLIKSDNSKPWGPSYNKIIDSFENELWNEKGRTGGFKPYEDAIAMHIFDSYMDNLPEVEEEVDLNEYKSIVQFHPSYTYEDFVRGISSIATDEGIIYKSENRTIARIAEDAKDDPENNYVLIIDEINRANLSSVFGELIYALEYRDKEVQSMYEMDKNHSLVIPSNLYIIGTMNTADRSVGHIDYAIRRRFAFVDVLPSLLEETKEIYFNTQGFNAVAELFNNKNVSKEFDPKDVQIGHSYFIVAKKSKENEEQRTQEQASEVFKIKMQYEVKPILLEYVKDGILIGEIEGEPIKEYIINDL